MKYSFSLPEAQEVYDDRISLSEVLPGIVVPSKCKSGRDIVFSVPHASGEKISQGDILVDIIFYDSNIGHCFDDAGVEHQPIISEHTGYIFHEFTCYRHTIDDLASPIIIYSRIEELIDERYPISYQIKQDEFTGANLIDWTLNNPDEDSYFSKYRLDGAAYIDLTIEKNLPVMVLGFSRKRFNVYKRDTISFKFEDGRVLHFPVLAPPASIGGVKGQSTVALALTANDIDVFENVSWDRMRIEHYNGGAPVTIENELKSCPSDVFSKALFKKYIQEYKRALNELGIVLRSTPERPVLETGGIAQTDDACYVYLMVDTSNGYHKIGISNHPDYREKTLQSEKPTIEKICAKRFPSRIIAQSIESALHTAFASKRIRGEWFNLSEQDVKQIIETLT